MYLTTQTFLIREITNDFMISLLAHKSRSGNTKTLATMLANTIGHICVTIAAGSDLNFHRFYITLKYILYNYLPTNYDYL